MQISLRYLRTEISRRTMPVMEDNSGRKRPNAFSIDSIIGKDSKRRCATPASRSPTPPSRHPCAPHPSHIPFPQAAAVGRVPPFSELANVEYHRNLAALGLLNQPLPPSVPQSGLLHHIPAHLQHYPGAQFHPAFINSHPRDAQLFPWLLARSDHLFPHRLSGHDAGLLLQPFRKAKRIRTAFSPSQLLKLEQSFDKNHYVVGQERKDLANTLSLTETQVKVWFQNRRTKYKRLKYEEGGDKSPAAGTSASCDEDDDLEIEADGSDEELAGENRGDESEDFDDHVTRESSVFYNDRGRTIDRMCLSERGFPDETYRNRENSATSETISNGVIQSPKDT